MKKVVIAICVVSGAVVFVETSMSLQAQGAPPSGTRVTTPAGELVATYCISCHNQKLRTAGLALDTADAGQIINSAETWEKVIVQLRSRSMPPLRSRRPDSATYDRVAEWLESGTNRGRPCGSGPD